MIVVSDTSCVTNLLAIERAEILRELFGEVVIPAAVARELRAAHAALPDFIREQPVKDASRARALAIEPLDAGLLCEGVHAALVSFFLLLDSVASASANAVSFSDKQEPTNPPTPCALASIPSSTSALSPPRA